MKRSDRGKTVHTVAEFVREANKADRRGSWNGATHGVACPSYTDKRKVCICVRPRKQADVVRVTWDGESHERLLYDAGKPHRFFPFPRPYPKEPPYVPMLDYLHKISMQSCGVDTWPKGWKKNGHGHTPAVLGPYQTWQGKFKKGKSK